ncbi:metallophosphoesterase family protein [Sphingobacterium corticibacter]|uniref:Nuclease SbcCD subunit D n=1 Tax=Sphingobacterium corticibacter TaxID=2171749 RepID=A0A2T8HJ86_9SPHI|nr:exonuclease SbcCD subunit D [Sphingobacterium corticibacter]PVH25372.1 exonuclease sbcCD subunit D [Sphingobacterium corticibacter]
MRILHTADWHLGKRLDFFSRIQEQQDVLNEICEIADQEDVDVVLVAGDLFDTFSPPVDAIELLYSTLKRLTNNGKRPVIAIAGNHDSADRIDAPDPLARACGIIFVGYPNAQLNASATSQGFSITHTDKGFLELLLPRFNYPLRIIATPYANELRLKQYLGEGDDRDIKLHEILATHWHDLAARYCDVHGVNLLITHLYMMRRGGEMLEEPEGEKPLKIGNADLIYTDAIPSQIQYTALGHLHRHHQLGTASSPIVYSGSPLAYSFSEAGQEKKVILVDLAPNENAQYAQQRLHGGRTLVRKRFDDITTAVEWLQNNPNTLVELTMVSDTFMTSAELKSLQEAHDGIIHIIPIVQSSTSSLATEKPLADLEKDVKSLFVDYFQSRYGQQPNDELLSLFEEINGELDRSES